MDMDMDMDINLDMDLEYHRHTVEWQHVPHSQARHLLSLLPVQCSALPRIDLL